MWKTLFIVVGVSLAGLHSQADNFDLNPILDKARAVQAPVPSDPSSLATKLEALEEELEQLEA